MVIYICAFTDQGLKLINKIKDASQDNIWVIKNKEDNITQWISQAFNQRLPIVFIGAVGIAVRLIAPFIKDKLTDSPIIAIDEKGKYVIPILSGHVGGANLIAKQIARVIKGESIITTATDIENVFAVDVFAKKNGFNIDNRDGIKKVSSKILSNEKINIWIDPNIKLYNTNIPNCINLIDNIQDNSQIDVCITEKSIVEKMKLKYLLLLTPKCYSLGIGCKQNKTFYELHDFVKSTLEDSMYTNIKDISSIDIKKNEIGLNILAQYLNVPFYTYSADELNALKGDFSQSDFVKSITGVSNVCERAAYKTASKYGSKAELIVKKIAEDGMTLSVCKSIPIITSWETNNE